MCMSVLPACLSVTTRMLVPIHAGAHGTHKREYDSLGTGVTDGCELTNKSWEANPGPLQEQ